jgi:hypothetical protein
VQAGPANPPRLDRQRGPLADSGITSARYFRSGSAENGAAVIERAFGD